MPEVRQELPQTWQDEINVSNEENFTFNEQKKYWKDKQSNNQ